MAFCSSSCCASSPEMRINCIPSITGSSISYNMDMASARANVTAAISFLKQASILTGIRAEDILERNVPKLLDLLWVLIAKFEISRLKLQRSSLTLLKWVQAMIPELRVTNFSSSWESGRAYLHLFAVLRSGAVTAERLRLAENCSPLKNATDLLEIAYKHGIIPILTPEDLVSAEPRSTMLYVLQFYRYWASHHPREALAATHVTDPTKCCAFGSGLQHAEIGTGSAAFTVETYNLFGHPVQPDRLDIEIRSPSDNLVQVNRSPSAADGKTHVSYVPLEVGNHIISVTSDGKPIGQWMVDVRRATLSLLPTHTKVTGRGLKITSHFWFTIQPHTKDGVRISLPGYPFVVSVKDKRSTELKATVDYDSATGFYVANYFPTNSGAHLISVTLDGRHVARSPYTVDVKMI